MIEAANLKRAGVEAGVPDMVICQPVGKYHGMFVELKPQKGGKLTNVQVEWLEKLNANGYYAVMCEGADKAIMEIEKYLQGIL